MVGCWVAPSYAKSWLRHCVSWDHPGSNVSQRYAELKKQIYVLKCQQGGSFSPTMSIVRLPPDCRLEIAVLLCYDCVKH